MIEPTHEQRVKMAQLVSQIILGAEEINEQHYDETTKLLVQYSRDLRDALIENNLIRPIEVLDANNS